MEVCIDKCRYDFHVEIYVMVYLILNRIYKVQINNSDKLLLMLFLVLCKDVKFSGAEIWENWTGCK